MVTCAWSGKLSSPIWGRDLDAIKKPATTIDSAHSSRAATLRPFRRFFRDADRPHSEAFDRQNPFIGRAPERATRPEANHLIELPCGSNLSSTGQSARA